MSRKEREVSVEGGVEGRVPTIEEWNATQRSSRCGVCGQSPEIREMVDDALRKGIGSVRVTRYLSEIKGIEISEPKVAHHRKAKHHLAEGTVAA